MASISHLRAAIGRTVIRVGSVLTPGFVERLIIARFCTPVRRPTAQPDAGDLGEEWTVSSGGQTIQVYSAGPAPRVLLVHGWNGSAHDFAALAATFRAAGFGTVTFDQPAHGRSTGRQTTLPELARAVLDVARATGPFAAVIGHSLGGSATLIALRDGLAARCAVLIAPPYDARPFMRELGAYMGATQARISGAVKRLERTYDVVRGRATDRIAAQVRTPGLVLHDRSDRAVPFTHGVALAAAWPGSRFVALDGLGHRRLLDAPSVHAEILTFIRQSIAEPWVGAPLRAPRVAPAPEAVP
jgi:pimeloyl-ACP methyl ester carboxylesterase